MSAAPPDIDNDNRQPGIDSETGTVRTYGHEAPEPERSMLSALVKRYFKAAAAADGVTGCRLLEPGMARGMPVDYGRLGPSYMRGPGGCGAILARLFRHDHAELLAKDRELKIVGVRTGGGLAFVLLHFPGLPERQIPVERQDGSWRVEKLLDDGIISVP